VKHCAKSICVNHYDSSSQRMSDVIASGVTNRQNCDEGTCTDEFEQRTRRYVYVLIEDHKFM